MKNIDTLAPRVARQVKGCPHAAIVNALRDAAINLCEEADVWTYSVDDLVMFKNIDQYELQLPEEAEIVRISGVSVGSTGLTVRTAEWLDRNRPGWRNDKGTPNACHVEIDDDRYFLRVTPKPSETQKGRDNRIAIGFVLKPTLEATQLDDFLVARYQDTIVAGALWVLYMLPDRPWSSENRAEYWDDKFRGGVASARGDVLRGFTGRGLSVTSRSFGF
jgi:hypothetical protein